MKKAPSYPGHLAKLALSGVIALTAALLRAARPDGWITALAASAFLLLSAFPEAEAQSQGDELVTVTVDGFSKAASPTDAVREVTQKAMADTAREQVIEILGDKKYQKNKQLIESKIVRESAKFIPFMNPGQPVAAQGGFKVPVEIKLSLGSLRKMIQQAGLLYDSEGPASVLPLISFIDRAKTTSYRWWTGDRDESKKFLMQLNRTFNQTLFIEMGKQGFYVFRPQANTGLLLPAAYRVERPGVDDYKFYGEFFRTPMILRGEVRMRPSRELSGGTLLSVKLAVFQAANQRSIAEVARTYEVESSTEGAIRSRLTSAFPEVAKDLSSQVLEIWQKGTLGANLVRVSVRGRLNPKQLNELKSSLQKSVREIKSVRERMFEPNGVTLELDYAGATKQIGERFKSLEVPGFSVRVAEASENGVVLDLKAVR